MRSAFYQFFFWLFDRARSWALVGVHKHSPPEVFTAFLQMYYGPAYNLLVAMQQGAQKPVVEKTVLPEVRN